MTGPSLRLSELEAWCRSRKVSEADESQLRAVFKERDRFERDLLSVHDALHRECDGGADLPGEIRTLRAQVATLTAERDHWKASHASVNATLDAVAASVARTVEAERAECLDLAVDAMSPLVGTDNDAHNEACRRIIDAIKRRGTR